MVLTIEVIVVRIKGKPNFVNYNYIWFMSTFYTIFKYVSI